jgi:hypothetical protein
MSDADLFSPIDKVISRQFPGVASTRKVSATNGTDLFRKLEAMKRSKDKAKSKKSETPKDTPSTSTDSDEPYLKTTPYEPSSPKKDNKVNDEDIIDAEIVEDDKPTYVSSERVTPRQGAITRSPLALPAPEPKAKKSTTRRKEVGPKDFGAKPTYQDRMDKKAASNYAKQEAENAMPPKLAPAVNLEEETFTPTPPVASSTPPTTPINPTRQFGE